MAEVTVFAGGAFVFQECWADSDLLWIVGEVARASVRAFSYTIVSSESGPPAGTWLVPALADGQSMLEGRKGTMFSEVLALRLVLAKVGSRIVEM
jgi:hypothetical protein